MCGKDIDPYFEYRFRLAWEHFRFHAEQRTKMFHFFILLIGAILSVIGLLFRDGNGDYIGENIWLVLLAISFVASVFMALDVRNTQLLEMSEDILEKLEREFLYNDWKIQISKRGKSAELALGILSRERILKNHLKEDFRYNKLAWRFTDFDNIKHKTNIRLIIIVVFLFSGFFLFLLQHV